MINETYIEFLVVSERYRKRRFPEHTLVKVNGRRLGYRQSSIARELDRGNIYDFSHLDRRTLLSMDIHARIKYSAMRDQYIAIKNKSRIGQGILLTPELKELIEIGLMLNIGHLNKLLGMFKTLMYQLQQFVIGRVMV